MKKENKQTKSSASNSVGSWEPINQWYRTLVGEEGHYYHQKIVIPGVLRLLNIKDKEPFHLLDLGCGNGILGRQLSNRLLYTGIDVAPSLVAEARKMDPSPHHNYLCADVTKKIILEKTFTHATIILALQNMEDGEKVFENLAHLLLPNGKLIIVLNHPCFRIPRQTFWGVDSNKKLQYRRIERYGTAMKIPIEAHPSQRERSASTWSYHHPLESYFSWMSRAGFVVENIEEWYSDKISTGSAAKMENRSRLEFPLFMTLCAKKELR